MDADNYLIIDTDGFDIENPQIHALATLLLKHEFQELTKDNAVFHTYPKPIIPPEEGETPPPPPPDEPEYKLILYKTDTAGSPLAGAQFYLYEVEQVGSRFSRRISYLEATSDANGKVSFKGLKQGLYSVYKTKRPRGINADCGFLSKAWECPKMLQ